MGNLHQFGTFINRLFKTLKRNDIACGRHVDDLGPTRFLGMPNLACRRKLKITHHDFITRAAKIKGAGHAANGC